MNEKTPFGLITTIEVPFALSAKGSCWSKEGLLVANYVYTEEGAESPYDLVYTIISEEGDLKDSKEDKGVLPTLFLSPSNENYASVVSLEDESEQTISFPIFNKESKGLKGSKSFNGRFVGCTANHSLFYDVDIWSDKQADTMIVLAYENDVLVSEKKVAIPFPKDNKICVVNGEIHLITEVEEGWLHRQIDENGVELRRRVLEFDFPFVHEALNLSFDKNSYLLCEENGEIGIVEIDSEGEGMYGDLYNIGDEFFGTWHPQRINENTNAVQFTTEFGNGWLVIKNDDLVELFYNKNKKGYQNLLTKEVLTIDNNDLVLSGISPIAEDKFGIVFYPRKQRKEAYNKLFVLQHQI
ncbi:MULTISPECIES: hypothetical protein [Myroides]|uniref:hypothetical protein n=1 Tax=Myroides TaxID=76831 RepID=UPI0013038E41|nr:hypothetical protein [Myroides phaeus]MEC4117521.1 hypothetical protein [Myroides phaeus]